MWSPTLLLATAFVAVLVIRLLRTGRRASGLPPGPPTVPILGNLHLLPARDIHLQFQKWAKEYGPVYSIILGTKTLVVLSSAEAVRDLLDKRSAIYSDRQDHYLGSEILSGGNRMLMMPYGPRWRMVRKMLQAFLNSQKSASYVTYQDLESKQMLSDLLDEPDQALESIRRYTMSLTASIVYGFRTTSSKDPRQAELYHQVETVGEIVQSAGANLLEAFPILRRLPDALLPAQKLARKEHVREVNFQLSLWYKVKEDDRTGRAKLCLAKDIVRVQGKEGFSDELGAYVAGTVFEAGSDTTSNTLYSWVQAMLLYPDVRQKAQKCIDEVVGSQRLPDMTDYPQLPYIRCCVKETTRWFPTTIFAFPHAVTEDDNYLGYHIPKGTGIMNNAYTIQMDESRHPEPHRFNPDRFKDDDQSLVEAIQNPDPDKRATFAFGAGRRICQGMHISEASLFLGISRILWAFEIVPAKDKDGKDILPDPTKITQGFVCMPEPFPVLLKPRSAERAAIVRKTWEDARKELDPETEQWK